MRISTIPHIYRNVRRWTEILSVLSKYGLADWLSRLNIEMFKTHLKGGRQGEALALQTPEKRIRLALTDLGPTFIKLGQLLSTRADLVGGTLADELRQLRDDVPADPPATVRRLVEAELGQAVEELFVEFDDVPVASASIGQVHRARLRSGEMVAVKVQHAGIERKVREDLDVLAGLALLAERIPEFAQYRPKETVAEIARMLRRELDFGREERNLQQFSAFFEGDATVCIPQAYTELCTVRVLTMQWIDGTKLTDREQLTAAGFDLREVARRGAGLYLQMIFVNGYYHADPHPGNIMLLPGNVISLLDFGMVGRVQERLREDIEEMLSAIVQNDVALLTMLIKRVGSVPPDLDESGLVADIADFVGVYSGQPIDRFDLSGALTDMTEIIRRYHISLPAQAAMLIKVLVTLEGTTRMLSAEFSLMEVMRPFHRKMLLHRLSPARQLRKLRRIRWEFEQLIEVLPRRIIDILEQVQTGTFDVHLDHRGLGPSVNRLVLGMLASALFLGSSLLLSREVPPVLFPESSFLGFQKLSVFGLTGCFVAVLLGLRLLRAIGKSGHLDRRE
ncbi:MAG: AarF/ABC1/UbiB kinase family protein [Planctomycetes bacterium]|nr:AarF/ABC1/UbiB kinase family protein [Planctomycetota bacterium]